MKKSYIGPNKYTKAVKWLNKWLDENCPDHTTKAFKTKIDIIRSRPWTDSRTGKTTSIIVDVLGSTSIQLKSDESGSGYIGGEVHSTVWLMRDKGIIGSIPFVSANAFHCAGSCYVSTREVLAYMEKIA